MRVTRTLQNVFSTNDAISRARARAQDEENTRRALTLTSTRDDEHALVMLA